MPAAPYSASYRFYFEKNPHPMWIVDRDSLAFLDANKAALRQYGYSREEFLKRNIMDIRPAKEVPALAAKLKKNRQKEGFMGTYVHQRKDGSLLRVEISRTFMDFQGKPATLILAYDVTKRHLAEEALLRTKLFMEKGQELGRFGTWTSDTGPGPGEALTWDKETLRIFGLNRDQFDGKLGTFLDFVHPEDLPAVRRAASAAIAKKKPYSIRHRIVLRDGRVKWVHEAATILRDEKGKPTSMVGIVQDITDTVRAETVLRESEELHRRLIELSPDGIFIRQGKNFALVNDALVRLLGERSPGRLLGRPILDWVYPDSKSEIRRRMLSQNQAMLAKPVELRLRRADGAPVDVEGVSSHFPYQGKPSALVIVRDISERRRAEEAVQLSEEQVRQAQKMEAVGRLAGGVAHDFNNILTAIQGYAEILLPTFGPADERRADVQEMIRTIDKAAALTRQLLALSRRQLRGPGLVDVNAVLLDMKKLLRRLIGDDVELSVAPSPRPALMRIDPGQMQQIILNLAVNAREAMPHGGRLALKIRTLTSISRGPKGPCLMLSVSDTGVGMDERTLARIFEPFFTTKRPGAGTGLGLSTVYGIVRQADGRVAVESKPGRGTTFRLLFPRVSGTPEPRARPDAQAAPEGSETILLVEDQRQVRLVARRMLSQLGYRVLEAANGEAALKLLDKMEEPLDLLLTDLVMPRMGGAKLSALLSKSRPRTRILYMSGNEGGFRAARDFAGGSIPLLSKPFSRAALAMKVREALDGRLKRARR